LHQVCLSRLVKRFHQGIVNILFASWSKN